MTVREIMSEPPQTCPAGMHLVDASRRMQETGCGTLIVLDARGRVGGIVTDRDLALAIGRSRDPASVTMGRLMTHPVHTCAPEDDVHVALDRMAKFAVRRLPVVDETGDVKGIVSIDDIVLWGLRLSGVSMHRLIAALRSICAASRPVESGGP